MSTSGGSDIRRKQVFALVAALLGSVFALALTLCVPAASLAASPSPARAELVFENGGRIVSIKADGSDRKVLTRKNGKIVAERAWDAFIPVRDTSPSISPDGRRLLFERRYDLGPVTWKSEVIVANRDGSGQKVILGWKSPLITWLGWDDRNRVVVGRADYRLDRKRESHKFWVTSFDQDGGNRELLISREFKASDFKNHDRFFSSSLQLSDLSPDGKSILYTVGDLKQSFLREKDIETGEDRLILTGVDQASYSPDGSAVAVTPGLCLRDGKPRICDGWKPGLWTANIDGTDRKRLVGGVGGTDGPDWSADGETILFTSARNFPGGGEEALEVYTVAVDGSCLTWLTNGSPESTAASWAPEVSDSRPGSCGANGREPLVEVVPEKTKRPASPRLWAGPEIRGRLLSSTGTYRGSENFYYADCAYYDRSKCREGMVIESIPLCNPGNLASGVDVFYNRMRTSIARGALLNTSRSKRGKVSAVLLTGKAQIYFGDSGFLRTGGIPTTREDLRLVVDLLRPVGGPINPKAKLPGPALSRSDARHVARVLRIYRQTGSIAATAKRAKTSKADVKWLVTHRKTLARLKPFRVAKCGIGSRSIRNGPGSGT